MLVIASSVPTRSLRSRQNSIRATLPTSMASKEIEIQRLVDERVALRRERKYEEADVLLEKLRKLDVLVVDQSFKSVDNPGGSSWSLARKWTTEDDGGRTIMEIIEGIDKSSEDVSYLVKRIKENSELSFAKDQELSGRSFSDAAFSLSLRGVDDTQIYNELLLGAKKELERCAHRASFRSIDIVLMAEKIAAAGILDQSFYALAAEKMRMKEEVDGDDNQSMNSTIEKLESGVYSLMDDRPLLTLFRHAARQAKAGLQAPDSSSLVNTALNRDINSLFEDPTLPLVVDLGCGYGVSLIGLSQQLENAEGLRYRYNCLGVDMGQEAVAYAQGVAHRWGIASHCQFVVADALSSLSWVESYQGPVEYVCCQFPTPFALRTNNPTTTDDVYQRDDMDRGNAQLPDMDTFIISPEIVERVGQVLHQKQGKSFIVQSQVEDVIVAVKAMVEHTGTAHGERRLRVPLDPNEVLDMPWQVERGDHSGTTAEWLSLDTLLERSASQSQREGSRLSKYLSSIGGGGDRLGGEDKGKWHSERAFGVGYLRENPLGNSGRTETEVMCAFEDKPIHRLAFVVNK